MKRCAKFEYTETEAAEELGVSVKQLRSMVRVHILRGYDYFGSLAAAGFQRSDLLILRYLSGKLPGE